MKIRTYLENLKILSKQLEKIKIQSVIKDKSKNKIKDKKLVMILF